MNIKLLLKTVRNCAYDGLRYLRHSGTAIGVPTHDILRAHIMMDTHRIEKGMALPTPRAGFGTDVLERLFDMIGRYECAYGEDFATAWSRGVMQQYIEFSRAQGISAESVASFLAAHPPATPELTPVQGGLTEVPPCGDAEGRAAAFADLVSTRHSVRQFAPVPVDPALIRRALALAAQAPSVCNRQSARLHHIIDPERKRCALEIQGGNRGFGNDIPDLLIVTSKLSSFLTSGERYQCWIDGGLFAMCLVFALALSNPKCNTVHSLVDQWTVA